MRGERHYVIDVDGTLRVMDTSNYITLLTNIAAACPAFDGVLYDTVRPLTVEKAGADSARVLLGQLLADRATLRARKQVRP